MTTRTYLNRRARTLRLIAITVAAIAVLAWIGWLAFALGLGIGAVLGTWIATDLSLERTTAAHARGFALGLEVGAHEQLAGLHHHQLDPEEEPNA